MPSIYSQSRQNLKTVNKYHEQSDRLQPMRKNKSKYSVVIHRNFKNEIITTGAENY